VDTKENEHHLMQGMYVPGYLGQDDDMIENNPISSPFIGPAHKSRSCLYLTLQNFRNIYDNACILVDGNVIKFLGARCRTGKLYNFYHTRTTVPYLSNTKEKDNEAFSPPYYPSPWGDGKGEWQEAYEKARGFVSQLTLAEKVNLTTGTG
jgi:hypothetical protein